MSVATMLRIGAISASTDAATGGAVLRLQAAQVHLVGGAVRVITGVGALPRATKALDRPDFYRAPGIVREQAR
jgi:hypothetical protein